MYLDLGIHSVGYLMPVIIEGLSSLKSLTLKLVPFEGNSFGNMNSLKQLNLAIAPEIDNNLLTKLFEMCPNIEELTLRGIFCNINVDSFVNLKKLRLNGDLSDEFNFDLFKNISNQLEELWIEFKNINDEMISKMFILSPTFRTYPFVLVKLHD